MIQRHDQCAWERRCSDAGTGGRVVRAEERLAEGVEAREIRHRAQHRLHEEDTAWLHRFAQQVDVGMVKRLRGERERGDEGGVERREQLGREQRERLGISMQGKWIEGEKKQIVFGRCGEFGKIVLQMQCLTALLCGIDQIRVEMVV